MTIDVEVEKKVKPTKKVTEIRRVKMTNGFLKEKESGILNKKYGNFFLENTCFARCELV